MSERPPSLATRWRWRAESLVARSLSALLRTLPGDAAAFLARRLGDLLFALLRSRVRTGRENLAAALPELQERHERILRESFQHFVTIPVELVRLEAELRRTAPEDIVALHGREHLETLRAEGGAAVFVTGHLGNWEVFGALGPVLGYGATAVGRALDNPLLHEWLRELRTSQGQGMTDKDGASREVLRVLRSGGRVAMLLDQHAGRHGLRVPFFGRPASTYTSGVHLARRLGVPVVPCFGVRTEAGLMRFRVQFFAPMWPDPALPAAEDHYRLLRYYDTCLEEMVRRHPGQYLWFHRRWRPGGEEPDPAWVERYAEAPSLHARRNEDAAPEER